MRILLVLLILIVGCSCPDTCDDANRCTQDTCSKETRFNCVHEDILPCDGNAICEAGEYPFSEDCPDCDDNNGCTKDTYNIADKSCKNTNITPCIGNGLCESGEYGSADCPECDDQNDCTQDTYDINKQACTHTSIIPCCGDRICEADETIGTCITDCQSTSKIISGGIEVTMREYAKETFVLGKDVYEIETIAIAGEDVMLKINGELTKARSPGEKFTLSDGKKLHIITIIDNEGTEQGADFVIFRLNN